VRKIVACLILATFVISVFAFASVTPPASAAPQTLPDYQGIDVASPKEWGFRTSGTIQLPSHHSYFNIGDEAYWLVYDDIYGIYVAPFQLKKIGSITEIWVQEDLSFPADDPRPYPTILDNETDYLLAQFENKIYPTDTKYFGSPAYRNGSNSLLPYWLGLPSDYYTEPTGRNVILVANIGDRNYYNASYPYFIIGVFVPSYDYYLDRNVITIDCADWEHRIGPTGTQWLPPETVPSNHAFDYESTIAHEYQHLIHNDYNPLDDDFMNEGCSMYAEYLNGYGIATNYLNSYFYTPDNSLTIWGDQGDINILADYGAAALWTLYLTDHYGGTPFITYFVQAGVPGIDGVNNALAHFKYKANFLTVYHDWRLANLIRSNFPGCGKYNYKSVNLNDPSIIPVRTYPISGLPVPWRKGTDFGNTFTILGYDTGVSMIGPFGTDYIKLGNWTKPAIICFDGDDTAIYGWTYDTAGGYWWSNGENLMNALLVGQASIPSTGITSAAASPSTSITPAVAVPPSHTLTIVTKYGIETLWDFGFVQVSTDNGQTWTSLSNEYTTSDHDPSAHPDIVANLPGLTGYSRHFPQWVTMNFDLSAYAGQNVMIGFRYMTDWATLYEGWFIQSASIDGVPLTLTPVYPKADFQVTMVYAFVTHRQTIYVPFDMRLNDKTETGFDVAFANKPSYIILVVSPTMLRGWVDYGFKATTLGFCYGHHWIEWC
jgi:immune inhibitor A